MVIKMSLSVSKAKELMIEQGMDTQEIDWASYSDDIPLEDYLKNEYNLVLRTNDDIAEGMKNNKEKEEFHKFYNPEFVNWKEINKSVKSIAIVGRTGTGKTAIAYKILEAFDKVIYIFRHPNPKLLNERGFRQLYEFSAFENLSDCVVFIDEIQLYISIYETKSNMVLMRLLSLCRQRNITLIISTSDTRFITRGLESYFDVWIVKDLEFDLVKKGSIIKKIVAENVHIIVDGFRLSNEEYLFYSREFEQFKGKHTFELPLYWNDNYSKPYAESKLESKLEKNQKVKT